MKTSYFQTFALILAIAAIGCTVEDKPDEGAAKSDFNPAEQWQSIQADFDLFYAYRDRRGFDAGAYLKRVGAYVEDSSNQAEFRRRLHKATYAFTDPHLGFGPFEDSDFNIIPTAADLQIDHRDGQYQVIDVRAGSAAIEAGIRPGWALVAAEDEAIGAQTAAVFLGLIDRPDDAQLDYAATLIANGLRAGDRDLTFISPDGERHTLTLPNPRRFAADIMTRPSVELSWIERVDGANTTWVRINNRLGDNDLILEFDVVMSEVERADGLILDLRNTPSGGNAEVGRSIMGHFVSEPRPFQIHERPSLEREFGLPRRYVEYVLPREPAFDPERTVILGGYWTGSMGEGIVIGLDANGVKSITSDMGDLLGGMSNFSFPDGSISLSIPNETLFHVDGTPREDFQTSTPLKAADTDEKGRDPALDAALAFLSQK